MTELFSKKLAKVDTGAFSWLKKKKTLQILRNTWNWTNFLYDTITQHSEINGTSIKITTIKLTKINIFNLTYLETLSQSIMLRIISKFYMFLEVVRRGRNIEIYCITWDCAFNEPYQL